MPKHPPPLPRPPRHREYESSLYHLQVELVKLQRHEIAHGSGIIVIFEGRDTAGKDGTIKRIVENLSPRETRVVALGPPDDRDRRSWYFERYVPHLPARGEMVLFNRSWYNRAGVERVMGFCTKEETRQFLQDVPEFERLLVGSGIRLIKYYLDITKREQKRRLRERRKDPLKQWKLSPVDTKAPTLWGAYSKARNEMLAKSHTEFAPWTIVRADDKDLVRINVIRDLLWRLHYPDRHKKLKRPDPAVLFGYGPDAIESGLIAP